MSAQRGRGGCRVSATHLLSIAGWVYRLSAKEIGGGKGGGLTLKIVGFNCTGSALSILAHAGFSCTCNTSSCRCDLVLFFLSHCFCWRQFLSDKRTRKLTATFNILTSPDWVCPETRAQLSDPGRWDSRLATSSTAVLHNNWRPKKKKKKGEGSLFLL